VRPLGSTDDDFRRAIGLGKPVQDVVDRLHVVGGIVGYEMVRRSLRVEGADRTASAGEC
jgi:hypothetical protein